MSSSSSYVSLLDNSGSYGDIPAHYTAANNPRFYILLVTNTPTGAVLPFSLQLQDANADTRTLNLSFTCVAQLSEFTVTPKIGGAGTPVTFHADFVNANNQPDLSGVVTVTLSLLDYRSGESNQVSLTPVTAGQLEATWTPSREADWQTDYYVTTSDGRSGISRMIRNGGFSSRPYDGTADVLLYSDASSWPYDLHDDMLAQAITNAGVTCFTWPAYYRSNLTAAVLANQHSAALFYYAPGYPSISSDPALAETVSEFAQDGGSLIMVGGYVACGLASAALYSPVCASLLSNTFGANWLTNMSSWNSGCFTNIQGIANDPIGNGLNLFTLSPYVVQDEIQAVNNGTACFRYDPASAYGSPALRGLGIAGVRTLNTVLLAWDPIYLSEEDCDLCIKRALNYLGLDGRGILQFDASAYAVPENAGSVNITVSRKSGQSGAASVRYATANGSASAPQDYTATSGTLTWADGVAGSYTISVPIVDDALVEGQKNFTLQLSDIHGANLGARVTATVTIEDDDRRAVPADFDGDRRADPTLHSGGSWSIWFSASQYAAGYHYPLSVSASDWAIAGDFDGDGKADPAVCAPETGNWHVWLSQQSYQLSGPHAVGIAGATATAADFDGDRKADPAAFRAASGEWFVWLSGAGYTKLGPFSFGMGATDIPVPADYDGDGQADPAVYTAADGTLSVWFSAGGYFRGGPYPLGFPAGSPAAADFDQDGKADPMLYEPDSGLWYFLLSGSQYARLSTTL